MTEMEREEKTVLCNDVILYMDENHVSLDQAYEDKKVPEDMRIGLIEMIEFLYPSKKN